MSEPKNQDKSIRKSVASENVFSGELLKVLKWFSLIR